MTAILERETTRTHWTEQTVDMCLPEVRFIDGLWRIRGCCYRARGVWFMTRRQAEQWAIDHAGTTGASKWGPPSFGTPGPK